MEAMEILRQILEKIFLGCVSIATFTQLFGLIGIIRFRSAKKAPPLPTGVPLPGITIIKACYGIGENEEENFDVFFRQNYKGPIQLIFAVSNESDPVVPTVRRYLNKYPKADAILLLSHSRTSHYRKIDALYDAHQVAKHELIIWSDSDVVTTPTYVSEMVASLMEPGISLVSTPQYDIGAHDLVSGLQVANNCHVGTVIMGHDLLQDLAGKNKQYAFGHSIGFHKAEFDSYKQEIWDFINSFLADDQALPYFYAARGKKVVFRSIYCPVHCGIRTIKQFLRQRTRWSICQRIALPNPVLFWLSMFLLPQISALFFMLATGFSTVGVTVFFGMALLRILTSFAFEFMYVGKSAVHSSGSLAMTAKYFWLILPADLLQIYLFSYGALQDTIDFHGKLYRVVNRYFMKEV